MGPGGRGVPEPGRNRQLQGSSVLGHYLVVWVCGPRAEPGPRIALPAAGRRGPWLFKGMGRGAITVTSSYVTHAAVNQGRVFLATAFSVGQIPICKYQLIPPRLVPTLRRGNPVIGCRLIALIVCVAIESIGVDGCKSLRHSTPPIS